MTALLLFEIIFKSRVNNFVYSINLAKDTNMTLIAAFDKWKSRMLLFFGGLGRFYLKSSLTMHC